MKVTPTETVTGVRGSWCMEDDHVARQDGWELHLDYAQWAGCWDSRGQKSIRSKDSMSSHEEAFQHVLEQAMCGNPVAYKALRIVAKTNPAFKGYKRTVRAIFKEFHK